MNAVEVKRDDEQSQPGAPDSAAQGPIAADQDTDSASASLSDTGRVDSEKETLEIRKLALEPPWPRRVVNGPAAVAKQRASPPRQPGIAAVVVHASTGSCFWLMPMWWAPTL